MGLRDNLNQEGYTEISLSTTDPRSPEGDAGTTICFRALKGDQDLMIGCLAGEVLIERVALLDNEGALNQDLENSGVTLNPGEALVFSPGLIDFRFAEVSRQVRWTGFELIDTIETVTVLRLPDAPTVPKRHLQ